MRTATTTSRFSRNPRIITQQAAGTTVLLSLDGGQYYSLDAVGGRAWELCDGTRTLADVAHLLSQEFQAATELIQEDLIELFDELADEKLVLQNHEESGGH